MKVNGGCFLIQRLRTVCIGSLELCQHLRPEILQELPESHHRQATEGREDVTATQGAKENDDITILSP